MRGRMLMRNDGNPQSRYDIWSIPSGKFRWYVSLLLTVGSAVCGFLIYGDWNNPEHETYQELTKAVITDVIISYTGAAIASLVLIQWGETIMVLVHFLKEKTRKLREEREERERLIAEARQWAREQGIVQGLEQGREQGLEQGRAEVHAQWESWNLRRLAAESAGEPFDEPPPAFNLSV